MAARKMIPWFCIFLSIALIASLAFSMSECVRRTQPPIIPLSSFRVLEPMVLSSAGDTTWIQVHTDSTYCPGDPLKGHGGEATGGPGPMETWCFEGDSCGANPPWDSRCFQHEDVRAKPSQTGINFWHVDTYRADQRAYCGVYSLWCGSDSLWTDGNPVECNTWVPGKYPGYSDAWNCWVQLELPGTFDIANGCTLYFDPRYDLECKYDYFYIDYWSGSNWVTLATFNASSDNPGPECGASGGGNPDYWGNTDTGQPNSADWQERTNPGLPAFEAIIPADSLTILSGPRFRWRVVTDGMWSDSDGRGNTDGAAFIDNVRVRGDDEQYEENFESGTLGPYWSLADPDGVIDQWHISHDPDAPYEGGDGGDRNTCVLDSSLVFRARPENGYQGGTSWRNQWYYRLMSPSIPIMETGYVIQYDDFSCWYEYTCDYGALRVRYHDATYGQWCPWQGYDNWICSSGCFFWSFDHNEDVTPWMTPNADSVQFGWDIQDISQPGDFCHGRHTNTEYLVDNVSIGYYDATATEFRARGIDLLQDTFYDNLCGYNSHFDAYDPDTVSRYSGPPYDDIALRKTHQLYLDVIDRDGLVTVEIFGSITEGTAWVSVEMTKAQSYDPDNPQYGGEHYGTLCPTDFGLSTWEAGTEVQYYVKATDVLSNEEYFPGSADPSSPYHTGDADSYYTFSILPIFPGTYTGPKILLVDGYGRKNYDWSECLADLDNMMPLEDIYEQTLVGAGYCYDKYDISGAGSNVHIHPVWFDDYDAVVWFTGPYFCNYLFDKEAQEAIRDFLGDGGKVVLCGDRIAFSMALFGYGEDSLGGEFIGGIMGCEYLEEDYSPFDYPYYHAVAEETVYVFGTPTEIDLGTLLIYRECPYLKDMSLVLTNETPPADYTAQPLLAMLDVPGVQHEEADEAIYTEYQGVGQCVYVNFDLCASVNHERSYCDGNTAGGVPDFDAGTYDGRVELMRIILEDLFGLPSTAGGGHAGRGGPGPSFRWALAQNVPNPVISATGIKYEIGRSCHVSLKVYNAMGQLISVIEDGAKDAGQHTASWDCRNASGGRVASGVYFYKIEAGGFRATRKMLVIN